MSGRPTDTPGVLILPPWLFLICAASGTIAHLACPYRFALAPWALAAAIGLWLAATGFTLWGVRAMKAGGTNVRPDQPALSIVSNGPFALTRNPLYLGMIGLFTGVGIAIGSPAFLTALLPLVVVLHFGVVLREERYLEAKFGDSYRAYKARVRRWI
jgi:protein-S-isoprenylcysteine O-methyltransferase Ste14